MPANDESENYCEENSRFCAWNNEVYIGIVEIATVKKKIS
jgi:hypothetical protein